MSAPYSHPCPTCGTETGYWRCLPCIALSETEARSAKKRLARQAATCQTEPLPNGKKV